MLCNTNYNEKLGKKHDHNGNDAGPVSKRKKKSQHYCAKLLVLGLYRLSINESAFSLCLFEFSGNSLVALVAHTKNHMPKDEA